MKNQRKILIKRLYHLDKNTSYKRKVIGKLFYGGNKNIENIYYNKNDFIEAIKYYINYVGPMSFLITYIDKNIKEEVYKIIDDNL